MQPTSVHAPSGRAACHAPAGTTAWTACATGDVPTEAMNGDRRLSHGPDPQLERITRRVLPDLVGVDPMPVRPLAGRKQVDDRAAARPFVARRAARHASAYQPPSGWARMPRVVIIAAASPKSPNRHRIRLDSRGSW